MSPGVTEEMRSGVYEVTRVHTNYVDQQYQIGLSAIHEAQLAGSGVGVGIYRVVGYERV
ncbi:putative aldo/keto reductase-like oxidoreductase [Arthrobacter psychrochitiniphilus]|nr:putative aldo/keto reductase-like oxidoreductase [Arthrobacter psychrochitiniphilus]